ncbi:general secretion pathway protein GspB [Desulfatitalea tepidiphila]|uniref:general secretion pathway protein GspB n=1 Tax=Desulfatitalea tepidiphila TaxID=1185843 RepID=UPI0006B4C93D|nr:general secretion pathway protein GspB [Desulfatitalea tepidiphila]
MSTILKALKRLETEQALGHAEGLPAPLAFNTQGSLRRKKIFGVFPNHRWAWIVIVLFLLATVTIVVSFIQRQPPQMIDGARQAFDNRSDLRTAEAPKDPSATPSASSAPAPAPESDPVVLKDALEGRPVRSQGPPSTGEPSGSMDSPGQPPHTGPSFMETPQQRIIVTDPPEDVGQGASIVATQMEKPDNTPLQQAPSDPAQNGADPYATARRMTDGRLEVQAIAWAEEPSERMAVINNHIVREGGSVEGFFIVRIGKDTVILRENGRLLKILFGEP